ncbi:MAG: hypothetical protein HeimC2_06080 [Candidatus Heimdallarchaeota archaeon LC_2]|nr:MAG: hypothetical protein HeimC2_06080 [Candidatus Heimdallarchaeota archaeon LC_2]
MVTSILVNPLDNLIIFIEDHHNKSMKSVKGKIINETKYMIHLMTDTHNLISIPKKGGKFIILSENIKIIITGDLLLGNAKSRSKKKYRKW